MKRLIKGINTKVLLLIILLVGTALVFANLQTIQDIRQRANVDVGGSGGGKTPPYRRMLPQDLKNKPKDLKPPASGGTQSGGAQGGGTQGGGQTGGSGNGGTQGGNQGQAGSGTQTGNGQSPAGGKGDAPAGGQNAGDNPQGSGTTTTVIVCIITKVGNPSDPKAEGTPSGTKVEVQKGEGDQAPKLPPECQQAGNASGSGELAGGSAKELAKQILENKNIELQNSSRKDIQAAADDKAITNADSCGKPVKIDPALLKVMLELAKKHKYTVWNIVTEHGCDQFRHPKGKAMDIGTADGIGAWQNKAFRQTAADVLPEGGELLQTQCPGAGVVKPGGGVAGAIKNVAKKLIQGAEDKCTHQHISVGE